MGAAEDPQQTTSFTPMEGTEDAYRNAINSLFNQANAPQPFFPDATVAAQTPLQTQATTLAPSIVANQTSGAGNALEAFNFTLNDMLNPATNPHLQSTADAAVNTVFDNLNERVLPGLTDEAIATGGLGGTRRDLARGVATQKAIDQAGNISSGIFNNAYNNSLDNFTSTLLNAPTVLNSQSIPATTALTLGGAEQQQQQAQINASRERFEFERDAPYNRLNDFLRTVMQVPGGSTTTTSGATSSPFQRALGSGAITYAAMANPYVALGAAILGGLS